MPLALKTNTIKQDGTLLKSRETKFIKKNNIIYLKGNNIEFIYTILDGEVNSFLDETKNIKENIVLKKGSTLGLMDLIINRNYSKTMIAKNDTVLALIDKNYFLKLLKPLKSEAILIKSLALDIDNYNKNIWS
jgi:CRP-like cAMP-binding protein